MQKKLLLATISIILLSCSNTENNNSMGLFGKLFGKSQSDKEISSQPNFSNIEKTVEMLDENIFWNIIDNSLKNTNNQKNQEVFLINEIEKLTPKEIIGFRLRTDKLLYDTYNSKMWCAGYIMNGGCSDDGFEYFRNWVISRGKDVYYKAEENPDTLIGQKENGEDEMFDFESFWYVALEAFNKKTGKNLYDFIDYENFKTTEGNYPQFEFDWKEENPESMKKLCPQLFEHFWN
ncbi:DUF4240 domain-containing protein [Chryseobacterium indologenes]|uniref:DUF4240 domain-containing protein n=1 Tax=Chryseobacterium indologenes TaxID=253 RepID=UPI001E6132D8|nr:DUF4240 domain-containing protein [Chryseobacterium indologenes]